MVAMAGVTSAGFTAIGCIREVGTGIPAAAAADAGDSAAAAGAGVPAVVSSSGGDAGKSSSSEDELRKLRGAAVLRAFHMGADGTRGPGGGGTPDDTGD